eukprot:4161989-Amphidinium_carterae.1
MATTRIDGDLYQVRLGSEVSGVTTADNLNRTWGVESHKSTGTPDAAELPTFVLKDVLPDEHLGDLASSCSIIYKMPLTRYVEYCDSFPTKCRRGQEVLVLRHSGFRTVTNVPWRKRLAEAR